MSRCQGAGISPLYPVLLISLGGMTYFSLHFSTHHLPLHLLSLSLSHTHTLLSTLFSETPKGTTFEIQDLDRRNQHGISKVVQRLPGLVNQLGPEGDTTISFKAKVRGEDRR